MLDDRTTTDWMRTPCHAHARACVRVRPITCLDTCNSLLATINNSTAAATTPRDNAVAHVPVAASRDISPASQVWSVLLGGADPPPIGFDKATGHFGCALGFERKSTNCPRQGDRAQNKVPGCKPKVLARCAQQTEQEGQLCGASLGWFFGWSTQQIKNAAKTQQARSFGGDGAYPFE